MAGELTIFISSTCHDLFQERHDLARELAAIGHEALISELPGVVPVDPAMTTFDACLAVIEKLADIVVVVVKNRYGSTDTQGVSITRKEYRKARQLRKPVFVFVHAGTLALLYAWRKGALHWS